MTGDIDVRTDQKIMIIGDFQTGKTTFAMWLINQVPRYLVWDPTWVFEGGYQSMSQVASEYARTGRAVFQPPIGSDAILVKAFDEFCWFAMAQANAVVFIDEPTMVMDAKGAIPDGFNALWRLGHKRGLGAWLATHRFHGDLPSITRIIHHQFIFRCTVDIDLEALKGYVGHEGIAWIRQAPDYHYWYRGLRWQGPCDPIPLDGPSHSPSSEPGPPAADPVDAQGSAEGDS